MSVRARQTETFTVIRYQNENRDFRPDSVFKSFSEEQGYQDSGSQVLSFLFFRLWAGFIRKSRVS